MTGPMCGATRESARFTWVCVRPPHGGDRPAQDSYLRRGGVTPSADKHVMVRADRDRP